MLNNTCLQVTGYEIPEHLLDILDKNGLSLPWDGSICMCPDKDKHKIRIKIESRGGIKPFFRRVPGELESPIKIKIVNGQCTSIE